MNDHFRMSSPSRRAGSPPPVPAATDGLRECSRGPLCSAKTRDGEGEWHPALTPRALCDADAAHLSSCMAALPALWFLAGSLAPARGAARVRLPPGSRVLVNAGADALREETAAITAGWAARVRAVPGLALSPPRGRPGTPGRVTEDCGVLAAHTVPLLALAADWTARAYVLPEGWRGGRREGAAPDRTSAACRLCGRLITRSPFSGWWWAPDGLAASFCDHEPAPGSITAARVPDPPEILAEISGDEILKAGDDWAEVWRRRDGACAAAELFELHHKCQRAAGASPAPPEPLDGVSCRECEEINSLVRADPPADPRTQAMWSRCTACGALMDRQEYGEWVAMYKAWVKGAGPLICRRCQLGDCGSCFFTGCTCRAGGHELAALSRRAARAPPARVP